MTASTSENLGLPEDQATANAATPPPRNQSERFFINVLWNWLTVASNILIGFYLTRLLIRSLGDERYGIWALAFSFIEYSSLFDLGFRPAVVNFVSRLRVHNDSQGISEVMSTALAYYCSIAVLSVAIALTISSRAEYFFKVSPQNRDALSFLLVLVGVAWAGAIISGPFQAALEAFQYFKISNSIAVAGIFVRSIGTAILLLLDCGLRPLGAWVVFSFSVTWILMYVAYRRHFPHLRISPRYISFARLKQLGRYGLNSIFSNIGTLFLNQGPPLVIAHYLPSAFVGYYAAPSRLLNYGVDMIVRIGTVTTPKVAELWALNAKDQVISLGTRLNRYCFALFAPVSIFLGVFGERFLAHWLRPEFAAQCAPLLPIFSLSVLLSVASQMNSACILYGIAKHGPYAISVMVEVVLSLAIMAALLPHYGIFGAAVVSGALAIVNRGLITPAIVCWQLHYSYFRYMTSIYLRPVLCAAPLLALSLWLRAGWLPGDTILQLVAAAGLISAIGWLLGWIFCVEPEHRETLLKAARQRLAFLQPRRSGSPA